MVSEDSHSNSTSSIMHQFIISNSIANNNQAQFTNHHFDAYGTTDQNHNSPYPHTLPLNSQYHNHSPHALSTDDQSHMAQNDRRLMDLLGTTTTSNDAAPQRLSLSLGSVPCTQRPVNASFLNPGGYLIPADRDQSCNQGLNDYQTFAASASFAPSYNPGVESIAAVIGSSKYLKPVQSLLEEMVTVGSKNIDITNKKYVEKLSRKGSSFGLKSEFSNSELLSDKHETYVTLLKLSALLEELERRYEEYYHHMDELVSSLEVIAGLGAGKSYTALALQAMSKHFSSLRSAILSQIKATKHKMEKDMPKISSRLSQLSLLDQESRQNRMSLQQLGILQNSRQVWRPIRGLPETSVTILRAWLFEHFLHPYPSDSEKLMLASQTGLSKNQISNWFINARVRLWKPMIEEMYNEEFGECSTESSDQLLAREGVGDSAEDLN